MSVCFYSNAARAVVQRDETRAELEVEAERHYPNTDLSPRLSFGGRLMVCIGSLRFGNRASPQNGSGDRNDLPTAKRQQGGVQPAVQGLQPVVQRSQPAIFFEKCFARLGRQAAQNCALA